MGTTAWDWRSVQATAPPPEYLSHITQRLGGAASVALAFGTLCGVLLLLSPQVRAVLLFAYGCFLRPLGKTSSQAERLDRFYAAQAKVYDVTRTRLLRGRRTMLQLSAQHLRDMRRQHPDKPLVWIDLGGGTGWNIEQMAEYFDLSQLHAVYLVDLCEPLLEVARTRFRERGWKNVHVLCQDASTFTLPALGDEYRVDLVTMSYSLSMIPSFYATLDRVDSILHSEMGVVAVCDFYAAPPSRNDKGRGCHPLLRWFWTWWFSWDHVDLHPARRDYLEHRFGTIKCVNGRNHFLLPGLIQMCVASNSPTPDHVGRQ